MKAYFDLEQRTDEWLELKNGIIGGTLSKGLFKDTDTLFLQLAAEQIEGFDYSEEDSYLNSDMQRGVDLEPEAKEKLIEYTKIKFINCGFLQSESIPILGISPDGITECLRFSCEIKCPGKKRHLETILSNDIPLDNVFQCIHYFTVNTKLEKHYFLSYRPENKLRPMFVKELTRESIVNVGTNSKPKMITINDAVTMARNEGEKIQGQINETIESLKF
jgi:hypothetical protein